MLNETIDTIIETEKKAEQMGKEAFLQGKEIYLQGELEADRIRKDVVGEVKAILRGEYAEANERADKAAALILEEGRKAAEKLAEDSEDKIREVAEEIAGRIISKYVGR
ncbi:MAG: hypothetical protein ACI4S9_08430 [Christensenellales bacterium]